jgi:O-antigen ligase
MAHTRYSTILMILFAITLHIQGCISLNGHLLNFSPSDILIMLALVALPIIQKRALVSDIMNLKKGPTILWLGACALCLSIAYCLGTKDSWALTKYAGFYILIGYYLMGLLGSDLVPHKAIFALSLIIFFNLSSAMFLLENFLKAILGLTGAFDSMQNSGLTGNPNIFSFLGCVVLSFHLSYWNHPFLVRNYLNGSLLFLEFISLLTTTSRAGWGCAAFLVLYGLVTRIISIKKVFVPILLLLSYVAIIYVSKLPQFSSHIPLARTSIFVPMSPHYRPLPNRVATSTGDRLIVLEDSLKLIQEKPLFGHGLGEGLKRSENLLGYPNIIHNTLLWLLVETGLAGAFCFLGLFFVFLRRFHQDMKENREPFSQACFMILLTFALFSLVHEMLYQRALWFILGIGMAQFKKPKSIPV